MILTAVTTIFVFSCLVTFSEAGPISNPNIIGNCQTSGNLIIKKGGCLSSPEDQPCCQNGKPYPQFKCSPDKNFVMTLNSFEKGGSGGAQSSCDNKFHSDSEKVAAVSTGLFNNKHNCGQLIHLSADNKIFTTAVIVDECDSINGCDKVHDNAPPCSNNVIDTSIAVWKSLNLDPNKGIVPIFINLGELGFVNQSKTPVVPLPVQPTKPSNPNAPSNDQSSVGDFLRKIFTVENTAEKRILLILIILIIIATYLLCSFFINIVKFIKNLSISKKKKINRNKVVPNDPMTSSAMADHVLGGPPKKLHNEDFNRPSFVQGQNLYQVNKHSMNQMPNQEFMYNGFYPVHQTHGSYNEPPPVYQFSHPSQSRESGSDFFKIPLNS
jgi:hypothetical protein